MAEEINEGVSYLRALKQYSQPPANEAARVVDQPGAEKRRSPRYKCEGSMEMRTEGCDVRTWATFTDVSLHGCYVEAQATYPVGTVLDLRLEARAL